MQRSTNVWAAGDVTAATVKFGGLAARQGDVAAADISARAGTSGYAVRARRALTGVLLTGEAPRALGAAWRPSVPSTKLTAEFLSPVLDELVDARV
jgi:hypothetical protein